MILEECLLSGCIRSKHIPVQSKMLLQEPLLATSSCHFKQVSVHYLKSILLPCKWTGGYIYQLVSWEFPFTANYSKNSRPEKFPFKATTNWTLVSSWWSVKYFFAPNSRFSRKVLTREESNVARQLQSFTLYKQTQKGINKAKTGATLANLWVSLIFFICLFALFVSFLRFPKHIYLCLKDGNFTSTLHSRVFFRKFGRRYIQLWDSLLTVIPELNGVLKIIIKVSYNWCHALL